MTKIALITGITGQDGYYLAKFLHTKQYKVFGLIRGQNNPKKDLIEEELPFVELIEGDLIDQSSLIRAINFCQPDEIYNLAAISFVAYSFYSPQITFDVTGKAF